MTITKLKYKIIFFCSVILILGVFITGLLLPRLFHHHIPMKLLKFEISQLEQKEEELILTGTFASPVAENETIWLYAENAKIQVHINGQSYQYNTRENTPNIFRSPGNAWYEMDSPGIMTDTSVKFNIQSYYGAHKKAAEQLLERIYEGDGSGLYKLLLNNINFFSIIQMFAMFAGIVYILEGVIDILAGTASTGIRISLFGFYCFAGGLWSLMDRLYPYLALLICPPWLAAALDMLGMLLFPVSLSLLMCYYIRGTKTKKVMCVISVVQVLTLCTCILIQLCGIADLVELQHGIGIIAIFSIAVVIICIVVDLRRYRDQYLLLMILTVLPVFFSIVFESINLFFSFISQRTLLQYSFSISVLLLIWQLASYAQTQRAKAEMMDKMQREVDDSRIYVLMSQIQPHFLFNSLTGIKQLCDTEPQKVSDALQHFADYLRENLDLLNQSGLISFEKEIEHVRDYLYLEKLRFEERLLIQWELRYVDFYLPPFTLQPVVENAVKHGISSITKDIVTVLINSELINGKIFIVIWDNGKGFDTSQKPDDADSHIGLENVKRRIEVQCNGSVEVYSKPAEGTKVVIILPQA